MTTSNPLFPIADEPDDERDPGGYVLPKRDNTVHPAGRKSEEGSNEAIDLIRAKLERIYAEAPDPFEEAAEAKNAVPRSKHQQFMQELTDSGKSLADIQSAWQNYYASLPDEEKHQVWQEFYAGNTIKQQPAMEAVKSRPATTPRPELVPKPALSQAYVRPHPVFTYQSSRLQPSETPQPDKPKVTVSIPARALPRSDNRTPADIREVIQRNVSSRGRMRAKDHLHSLLFGLGVGAISLVIFLFGFFNEVIVAPFIQPSRNVGATPIIINPSDVTASANPEVIIPKIHLEIPSDFTQTSTNEATIETALEKGIVHYPSTVLPGQAGNAAFFGHSSNNIFNPGKYKFAFVLLHELMPDDTFYLTYNGKVYVYKVFEKRVVEPSEVNVLNNIPGHTATATLITCDPPGTSLHRLIVVGDQISPDPAGQPGGTNTSGAIVNSTQLPGNGPSLFSRIWSAIF